MIAKMLNKKQIKNKINKEMNFGLPSHKRKLINLSHYIRKGKLIILLNQKRLREVARGGLSLRFVYYSIWLARTPLRQDWTRRSRGDSGRIQMRWCVVSSILRSFLLEGTSMAILRPMLGVMIRGGSMLGKEGSPEPVNLDKNAAYMSYI